VWVVLVGAAATCIGNACSSDKQDDGPAPSDEDTGLGLGGTSFVVGGGDGGGPDLSNVVETCAAASEDSNPMIDDFDDGNATNEADGRLGTWFAYDDESGGTQTPPANDLLPETGGVKPNGYALHVEGGGYAIWGSNYVVDFRSDCAYDASVYDGITFWARGSITIDPDATSDPSGGDRELLKVMVTETNVVPLDFGGECDETRSQCWDSHKARIALEPCWRRYVLPFADLEQDGWGLDGGELDLDRLYIIGFEIAQGHRYDYWLDELAFYRGEPPPEEEDCSLDEWALGEGGASGAGGAASR